MRRIIHSLSGVLVAFTIVLACSPSALAVTARQRAEIVAAIKAYDAPSVTETIISCEHWHGTDIRCYTDLQFEICASAADGGACAQADSYGWDYFAPTATGYRVINPGLPRWMKRWLNAPNART